MRSLRKMMLCGLGACVVLCFALGCESSSHKTVRTYEYNDAPEKKRSESDELDSEYKMESEGEMKGPE